MENCCLAFWRCARGSNLFFSTCLYVLSYCCASCHRGTLWGFSSANLILSLPQCPVAPEGVFIWSPLRLLASRCCRHFSGTQAFSFSSWGFLRDHPYFYFCSDNFSPDRPDLGVFNTYACISVDRRRCTPVCHSLYFLVFTCFCSYPFRLPSEPLLTWLFFGLF